MNLIEKIKKKKLPKNKQQLSVNDDKAVTTKMGNEKERLLESVGKFKEGYISHAAESISNHFTSIRNISLDAKVDAFIDWYYINRVKGNYTDIGEFSELSHMRNFIEKMAVWYELRYPEYEINRLMPGSNQEEKKVNDIMFGSNNYINELFDENADIMALDWNDFYNASVFINSLPCDERYLLSRPKYNNLVYIEPKIRKAHLHITSRGFVEISEGVGSYTQYKVNDDEIKGMHIKNVVKLLNDKGISLPSDNELEKTIKNVDKRNYQKEEMLNCVMYRIIERGGNRIGPRRAFLFAKEFGRNIDIPMKYGVDYSDPGLRKFINEYIKAGGSKDLVCYVGYFSRASKNEKMDTVSVQEMIKTVHNNCVTKYTPEETELQQRLVNILASQVDQAEVKEEEVKQLRLQRRLNKSMNRK